MESFSVTKKGGPSLLLSSRIDIPSCKVFFSPRMTELRVGLVVYSFFSGAWETVFSLVLLSP